MRPALFLLLFSLQLCFRVKPDSVSVSVATADGTLRDWQQVNTSGFFTPKLARTRGILYYGSNERLRYKLSQWRQGKDLSIAAVGGSITAGVQADGYHTIWCSRFLQLLKQAQRPGYGKITLSNGAVPGTFSQYMSTCVRVHVPDQADVVLVEYGVNDPWQKEHMDSPMRRAFERLLRKLMMLPSKPAIVLVNAFSYFLAKGLFWGSAERDFMEFSSYYQLPLVSAKACCFHLMRANVPGWQVNSTIIKEREAERLQQGDAAEANFFLVDDIHPSANGHRNLAELTWELFELTLKDLDSSPLALEEAKRAARGRMRPPMLPNNTVSLSDKCILGAKLTEAVASSSGFDWINESKHARPKWGFVGIEPGSRISFRVDTKAGSGNEITPVEVQVAMLKSYENMGRAEVSCAGGCTCSTTIMDGHQQERNSQTFLEPIMVSQAGDCLLDFQILAETSSGKHKFKIMGITISEQPGDRQVMTNVGAVEYVHDIAMRGGTGVFDLANHI